MDTAGSTPPAGQLQALLGTAGKNIAHLPGARRLVARLRVADSPQDLGAILRDLDIGLDTDARERVIGAATDGENWREAHATLLRSAEQQLTDRFSASS